MTTVTGTYPGLTLPRVPGHEVIGRVEALGSGVSKWKIGQRVGVGLIAGEDGVCESCRRGDPVNCQNPVTSGVTLDGGYAEVMIAEARGSRPFLTNSVLQKLLRFFARVSQRITPFVMPDCELETWLLCRALAALVIWVCSLRGTWDSVRSRLGVERQGEARSRFRCPCLHRRYSRGWCGGAAAHGRSPSDSRHRNKRCCHRTTCVRSCHAGEADCGRCTGRSNSIECFVAPLWRSVGIRKPHRHPY